MDRRNFLKTGSLGLGGLMLGGSQLPGLISEANAMSMATGMPWKFGVMADTQWGNRTTDPAIELRGTDIDDIVNWESPNP